MTTTKFNMTKDIAGYNGFGVVPSNVKKGVTLASGVEQNFTAPTDSQNYLAIFSYSPGTNVFVAINDTATVYSGTISDVTSELIPAGRQIKGGDTISMICPDTNGSFVQVSFYVVSPYVN